MSTRRWQRIKQAAAARLAQRRARPDPAAPPPPPPSAILWRRSTLIGLSLVFLLSFGVYVLTCARTVTGEDSGELVTAAYTLGVAHPPGYPIWCLLAKLSCFLPVGEVAFRVALLSAFFGALTVTALVAVLLLLTASWPAALAAAFGFGWLRDQWSQAVIAEVYTLNTFFLATCLLLLLLWSERRSWRFLNLFAFTFGLSLTNHLTMLGAALPFLLFLLIKGYGLLRDWRRLLMATACFVLGLLPYVYLPLAARLDPPVNWGDPRTFSGVLDHIARRQYTESGDPVPESMSRFTDQLSVLYGHATSQGATPLLVLGCVALIFLFRRRFPVFIALFGVAFFSTVVLLLYTNNQTDFENAYAVRLFFVPAYLVIAVAAGIGLGHVRDLLPRRGGPGLLIALALVLPLGPLLSNWRTCDYSGYWLVSDFGRRLLGGVAKDAILLPSSDHNTFPLLYFKFVEGLRPDVTLADKYGYIDPVIYRGSVFEKNVPERARRGRDFRRSVEGWLITTWNRPVYFSQKAGIPGAKGFEMVSEGMWFRARPADVSEVETRYDDQKAWLTIWKIPLRDEGVSPYDFTARMVLADVAFTNARFAFRESRIEDALECCAKGPDHAPLAKEIQNNFASLLAENNQHEAAWPLFRRAMALDPGYLIARRNLAISLRAAGHLQDAEAVFKDLLDIDPLDAVGHRGLAEIARTNGWWAMAAGHLEEVGRLTGDAEALRDAGLIHLFELKDDLLKAKVLLQASLRVNPNQPEVREVEQRIRSTKEEETAKEKKDQGDHSKHDCIKEGCEANRVLAEVKKRGDVDLPEVKDPKAAVLPALPKDPLQGLSPPGPRQGAAGHAAGPTRPKAGPPAGPRGRRTP